MKELLLFFEDFGDKYIKAHLAQFDKDRLFTDENYLKSIFLYKYAFERQGAPKSYKIAVIKALQSRQGEFLSDFEKYCTEKRNPRANPAYDQRIENLFLLPVLKKLTEHEFRTAFEMLALRGVGHKIRSLFLRDIYLLGESQNHNQLSLEHYLFMFPIDIWVRKTLESLRINNSTEISIRSKVYRLEKSDYTLGKDAIAECIRHTISPLKVNMGIWLYCAYIVGDVNRLRDLIRAESKYELENECLYFKDVLYWIN